MHKVHTHTHIGVPACPSVCVFVGQCALRRVAAMRIFFRFSFFASSQKYIYICMYVYVFVCAYGISVCGGKSEVRTGIGQKLHVTLGNEICTTAAILDIRHKNHK